MSYLDKLSEEVVVIRYAPVAQLDRASGFEPAGRRFNSCRAHQYNQRLSAISVEEPGAAAATAGKSVTHTNT